MGGAPKAPKQAPQAAPAAATPPPAVNLQTQGWRGMGVQLPEDPQNLGTEVTGIGTQAPSWMQGYFAAPWWGQQAPNVGAALLQQQNPDAYASLIANQQQMMQAPQQQAPQQQAPSGYSNMNMGYGSPADFQSWQRQQMRQGGLFGENAPPMNYDAYMQDSMWRRQREAQEARGPRVASVQSFQDLFGG